MNGLCVASDRLYDVVCRDFNLLCVVSRFGIDCGFGDKTIEQVCREYKIDCNTFLAVVNFHTKAKQYADPSERLSLKCLTEYLQNSHVYYLNFLLPSIRRRLIEALGVLAGNELAIMILKFFDEYCAFVRRHMQREDSEVFPYVDALLQGKKIKPIALEISLMHRSPLEAKLAELKSLIIRFYDGNADRDLLASVLYDLFVFEQDLMCHCKMETVLFYQEVRRIEALNAKGSGAASQASDEREEQLSEREKEVVRCVVGGMSNKEIAERLFISVNTVTTHRRNIARKTDIHSSAALTLYAIMNNLVSIDAIRVKKK